MVCAAPGLARSSAAIVGYVEKSGVPFVVVDHRSTQNLAQHLAPPDILAGITWLHEHRRFLWIDPARIGLIGEDAGPVMQAIALARDRGVSIARQIIVCPTHGCPDLIGAIMSV